MQSHFEEAQNLVLQAPLVEGHLPTLPLTPSNRCSAPYSSPAEPEYAPAGPSPASPASVEPPVLPPGSCQCLGEMLAEFLPHLAEGRRKFDGASDTNYLIKFGDGTKEHIWNYATQNPAYGFLYNNRTKQHGKILEIKVLRPYGTMDWNGTPSRRLGWRMDVDNEEAEVAEGLLMEVKEAKAQGDKLALPKGSIARQRGAAKCSREASSTLFGALLSQVVENNQYGLLIRYELDGTVCKSLAKNIQENSKTLTSCASCHQKFDNSILVIVNFSPCKLKGVLSSLAELDGIGLTYKVILRHSSCLSFGGLRKLLRETEDKVMEFRPNFFIHPNVRNDGWKVFLGELGRWFGDLPPEEVPQFPQPKFWDKGEVGSEVCMWPPQMFYPWIKRVKDGRPLNFATTPRAPPANQVAGPSSRRLEDLSDEPTPSPMDSVLSSPPPSLALEGNSEDILWDKMTEVFIDEDYEHLP
ncbi:hypothetical protein BYT27DRAFT_7252793 [Phlegmacium glaucopus]|nr:hypothetical protein BYT27DRAFT_7252793 [Phlegmacium glaucopus]